MHELTLSESIVRTAVAASGARNDRITAIAVRVGALSAVNLSSLEFCLRMVLDQHGMQRAETRVTWVPARLRCQCGACYETEQLFSPCPECGGFEREVVEGKDVTIEYVEVEDEED
ncbi:MAG: hydrogenase maturation nickel metallochaperone HypA/HybF [Planctomycetota bacterium]|jgi:hydrogenase nickel incorporation protein HypA/HybF